MAAIGFYPELLWCSTIGRNDSGLTSLHKKDLIAEELNGSDFFINGKY
jgi:hypothetical protein